MTVETNHLNHSTWECKYHVVFTPKHRRKEWYGFLRRELKDVLHWLAGQKGCVIEEGYLMPGSVHMLVSIPPTHAVSHVVGFLMGKSSWIAQDVAGKQRNFVGHKLWSRGYFVSTVGTDEKTKRDYIQNQEADDKRIDQLNLFNR